MGGLKGSVVGRLTLLKRVRIKGRTAWLCQCTCGKQKVVLQQSLKKPNPTSSCGCLQVEVTAEIGTRNLLGQRFGKWTVLEATTRRAKNGGVYWLCGCDCGVVREVSSTGLVTGSSRSCNTCRTKTDACRHGHELSEWGRTPSGSCKGCIKSKQLERCYGITWEEYKALYQAQDGLCAICKHPLELNTQGKQGWNRGSRIEVDHSHAPGLAKRASVRGLLCGGRWKGCNRRLGHVDRLEWLEAAANYVRNPPARNVLKD